MADVSSMAYHQDLMDTEGPIGQDLNMIYEIYAGASVVIIVLWKIEKPFEEILSNFLRVKIHKSNLKMQE